MKKLLILEDSWMMANMIKGVAQDLHIDVVGIATNWSEAEKLIKHTKPDFATVDINIGGSTDGIKAAKEMSKAGIDCIFLTAYKDIETINEASSLSPLAYIVKPVTPENLMANLLLAVKKIEQKSCKKVIADYMVENGELKYRGRSMTNLSKSERRVLGLLVKNIGHTVMYETLFYSTNSDTEVTNEATLRNIVAKLRKKCSGLSIKNIKDVGYIACVTSV